MKKAIYIFLGLLLLMQTGGMLLLYKVQEVTIQLRMADVLENARSGFEEISLSEDEYRSALIDKGELLVKGKVYDIKSQRIQGDRIIVTAMEDEDEEGVLRNIRKAVNHSNSKNVPDNLLQLLTITYILPATQGMSFFFSSPRQHFYIRAHRLPHYSPGIVSPPPEMV